MPKIEVQVSDVNLHPRKQYRYVLLERDGQTLYYEIFQSSEEATKARLAIENLILKLDSENRRQTNKKLWFVVICSILLNLGFNYFI